MKLYKDQYVYIMRYFQNSSNFLSKNWIMMLVISTADYSHTHHVTSKQWCNQGVVYLTNKGRMEEIRQTITTIVLI